MSAHTCKEHHIRYTRYGLWLMKLETSDDLHLKFSSDSSDTEQRYSAQFFFSKICHFYYYSCGFYHKVEWAVDVSPCHLPSITYASPHD